jgi:hypothetical protein
MVHVRITPTPPCADPLNTSIHALSVISIKHCPYLSPRGIIQVDAAWWDPTLDSPVLTQELNHFIIFVAQLSVIISKVD